MDNVLDTKIQMTETIGIVDAHGNMILCNHNHQVYTKMVLHTFSVKLAVVMLYAKQNNNNNNNKIR